MIEGRIIEIYNENTGEYKNIVASIIKQEAIDPVVLDDPSNTRFTYSIRYKTVLCDDRGIQIGDVLIDDSYSPRLLINNEVWWVVSIDGKRYFKQPISEEHASKEWLNLLED